MVVISCTGTTTADRLCRQRILQRCKMSLAVVFEQAVLVVPIMHRMIRAPADEIEVQVAVSISIEEQGIRIGNNLILVPGLVGGRREFPFSRLNIQSAFKA